MHRTIIAEVPMKDCFVSGLVSIIMLALLCAGCGNNNLRELQSITITPATADASTFATRQVQFIATGHYSKPPTTISPVTVLWSVYKPPVATIDQNGVAQCSAGMTGYVTVLAYAPSEPSLPISKLSSSKRPVLGMAQLVCP